MNTYLNEHLKYMSIFAAQKFFFLLLLGKKKTFERTFFIVILICSVVFVWNVFRFLKFNYLRALVLLTVRFNFIFPFFSSMKRANIAIYNFIEYIFLGINFWLINIRKCFRLWSQTRKYSEIKWYWLFFHYFMRLTNYSNNAYTQSVHPKIACSEIFPHVLAHKIWHEKCFFFLVLLIFTCNLAKSTCLEFLDSGLRFYCMLHVRFQRDCVRVSCLQAQKLLSHK